MKPIDKIIYLVSWMANVPTNQIFPSTHIKEDLEIDSIDFMLLVVQIEKLFDVVLTSDQVERMETVKDANDLIVRELAYS